MLLDLQHRNERRHEHRRIIGGIAPESTVDYYRSIITGYRERTPDGSALEHPERDVVEPALMTAQELLERISLARKGARSATSKSSPVTERGSQSASSARGRRWCSTLPTRLSSASATPLAIRSTRSGGGASSVSLRPALPVHPRLRGARSRRCDRLGRGGLRARPEGGRAHGLRSNRKSVV